MNKILDMYSRRIALLLVGVALVAGLHLAVRASFSPTNGTYVTGSVEWDDTADQYDDTYPLSSYWGWVTWSGPVEWVFMNGENLHLTFYLTAPDIANHDGNGDLYLDWDATGLALEQRGGGDWVVVTDPMWLWAGWITDMVACEQRPPEPGYGWYNQDQQTQDAFDCYLMSWGAAAIQLFNEQYANLGNQTFMDTYGRPPGLTHYSDVTDVNAVRQAFLNLGWQTEASEGSREVYVIYRVHNAITISETNVTLAGDFDVLYKDENGHWIQKPSNNPAVDIGTMDPSEIFFGYDPNDAIHANPFPGHAGRFFIPPNSSIPAAQ